MYQELEALARRKTELVEAIDKISSEVEKKRHEINADGPNTALHEVLEMAIYQGRNLEELKLYDPEIRQFIDHCLKKMMNCAFKISSFVLYQANLFHADYARYIGRYEDERRQEMERQCAYWVRVSNGIARTYYHDGLVGPVVEFKSVKRDVCRTYMLT